MNNIFFSSILKRKYRDELETLMFFNPQQAKVKPAIIESIEKYGNPQICVDGDFLRLKFETFSDVQTIFAFDNQGIDANLIGVIIYVRADFENIIVLHIAVREEYSTTGHHANEMLVMRLMIKVQEIASRIKAVNSITVLYEKRGIRRISV